MNQENQRYTAVRSISEKPCFSALEDQTESEKQMQEHTTDQSRIHCGMSFAIFIGHYRRFQLPFFSLASESDGCWCHKLVL